MVREPATDFARDSCQVCNKMGIGLIEDSSIVLLETPEAAQLQLSEIDLARLEVRLEDSQVVAG